ncbi:hypothetical protein ACFOWM_04275 [Ferruginibacter yonginensis]|uniref:Uncharacterized protein n=1 Tax=Ferruginibacter yonginensis TaxID=1310416 RepID=A0ABV8QR46_9BACT
MIRFTLLTTITLLFFFSAFCQNVTVVKVTEPSGENGPFKISYKVVDSGVVFIEQYRVGCKAYLNEGYFFPNEVVVLSSNSTAYSIIKPTTKFLTVHGNITYNLNYRSYIDTPFTQNDVVQQSLQTRLDITLKEQLPFTVFFTTRHSNSPFFTNATDVSFQFKQQELLSGIKKNMLLDVENLLSDPYLNKTPEQFAQPSSLDKHVNTNTSILGTSKDFINPLFEKKKAAIIDSLKKLSNNYETIKQQVSNLERLNYNKSSTQEAVEKNEKQLKNQLKNKSDNDLKIPQNINTINSMDSVGYYSALKEKQLLLQKNKEMLQEAFKKYQSYQHKILDSLRIIKSKINNIKDKSTLDEYIATNQLDNGALSKFQKFLLSVKQIGIGRTWIDYSELTVKNISLNGINVELNPNKVYVAAAAGKVNYRFRDYIVKGNYAGSNQSVGLLRAGFGKKDGTNFIVTYYSGKKALLNQRSINDTASVQPIAGISIETKAALNANNYLIAEYAKSTSPSIKGKIFDLQNKTNEAWSIKLFSTYGKTKLTSYYRKTGEGFQSFTLFPTNNKQDAWMIKLNQSLWRNKFLVDAAIRKNDFNSPIAAPQFSTTNIFKSLQLTLRVPKFPFISVGYYPSSQLSLSNNNVLFESRYNTLNAIVSHTYVLGNLSMLSNATYTKFYNQQIDSGFIYYNATTINFEHTINLKHFNLQGIASITQQNFIHQLSIEPVVTYQPNNKFSITGGAKWNRINKANTLWGGRAAMFFKVDKIGTIQLQYDKIYLPGFYRNLLPVDVGRITFNRVF